jgi:hypothetical protein
MAGEAGGREARLRELEGGLHRGRRSVKSHDCRVCCPDCGKVEVRGVGARRCRECADRHARERRVDAQRTRRLLAAGLVERQACGVISLLAPVKGVCAQCGAEFERRRTTARYCSAKCRVAAHRAAR